MRKKLVAGNWKMHKTLQEAISTLEDLIEQQPIVPAYADVWIAPPALYIDRLVQQFNQNGILFGTQDISQHDQGAYTGEWSGAMIQSCGGSFTLVGHSERRQYHGENDVLIHQKILAGLRNQIQVVYCCGEHLEQRQAEIHFDIVRRQITEALTGLSHDAMKHIVIAYEPVWAIGTGVNASAEQAGEMHRFIRLVVSDIFGAPTAQTVRILYGGSVKPGNARDLFSDPDIDGALIGGASLLAADFLAIIHAAESI
jgi:triosephosphate isomerase (TIM)